MAKSSQSKGMNTKAQIFKTAKSLFYKQGFTKTTTRQIANESEANLGLISYYYKNKAEIGLLIYEDTRKAMRKILQEEFQEETVITFLLHSMIDLKLLITNDTYRDLYLAISRDDAFVKFIESRILVYMKKYMVGETSEDYINYSCITISVVKPELVRSVTGSGQVDEEKAHKLIEYYGNLYASTLNLDDSIVQNVLQTLDKFYVNIVDNFTPIIVRTSE